MHLPFLGLRRRWRDCCSCFVILRFLVGRVLAVLCSVRCCFGFGNDRCGTWLGIRKLVSRLGYLPPGGGWVMGSHWKRSGRSIERFCAGGCSTFDCRWLPGCAGRYGTTVLVFPAGLGTMDWAAATRSLGCSCGGSSDFFYWCCRGSFPPVSGRVSYSCSPCPPWYPSAAAARPTRYSHRATCRRLRLKSFSAWFSASWGRSGNAPFTDPRQCDRYGVSVLETMKLVQSLVSLDSWTLIDTLLIKLLLSF